MAKRLDKSERSRLLVEIKAEYEEGAAIRAIASRIGFSYTATRQMLLTTGVQLRPRHSSMRARRPLAADDPRAVPCTYCGAATGTRCRSARGKRIGKLHEARCAAAFKAAATA